LNNGLDFYAGFDGGGFVVSNDSGRTWAARNSGLDAIAFPTVNQFVVKGSSFFIGTGSDGVFRTTNNGVQWTQTSLGQGKPITGLAVRGPDLIATANIVDGVYRSTNDGSTWTQIMNNFTTFGPTCLTVGSGGTIYVGTSDAGILRSADNGSTWFGSFLGGIPVFMRFVGTQMFAGTDNGPFRSTNFGATWQAANVGLAGVTVNFIAISDTNTLFASTSGSGTFVSVNNGASWSPANTGLPTLFTNIVRVAGSYVYCGTLSNGVWRRPLSDILTGIKNTSSSPPEGFRLLQNHPNPFNPTTTITFEIPVGTRHVVSLRVFNVLGHAVATLVNEQRAPGTYEVMWDASGFASGVYLSRLTAGSLAETKKLLLLR
jgi:hypothetical protein